MSDRGGSGTSHSYTVAREVAALRESLALKRGGGDGERLARNREEIAEIQAHLKRLSAQLDQTRFDV
jgi:hypothetical protein